MGEGGRKQQSQSSPLGEPRKRGHEPGNVFVWCHPWDLSQEWPLSISHGDTALASCWEGTAPGHRGATMPGHSRLWGSSPHPLRPGRRGALHRNLLLLPDPGATTPHPWWHIPGGTSLVAPASSGSGPGRVTGLEPGAESVLGGPGELSNHLELLLGQCQSPGALLAQPGHPVALSPSLTSAESPSNTVFGPYQAGPSAPSKAPAAPWGWPGLLPLWGTSQLQLWSPSVPDPHGPSSGMGSAPQPLSRGRNP